MHKHSLASSSRVIAKGYSSVFSYKQASRQIQSNMENIMAEGSTVEELVQRWAAERQAETGEAEAKLGRILIAHIES